MNIKNLKFYYQPNLETRKLTELIIPICHTQDAKVYTPRCNLKSEYIQTSGELGCYQIATIAQRLILFTDALGLHRDRLGKNISYSFYGDGGMDHMAHFTAGKKERVIVDAPYHQNNLSSAWRSVWLPRSSDYYLPGVTYGRISAYWTSTANLDELAERVSNLNFDLLTPDSDVQEHAAWLEKIQLNMRKQND